MRNSSRSVVNFHTAMSQPFHDLRVGSFFRFCFPLVTLSPLCFSRRVRDLFPHPCDPQVKKNQRFFKKDPIASFSPVVSLSKNNLLILYFLFFRSQVFRDHSIDGASLSVLSESHLTGILGLRLGPAIRIIRAVRDL